MLSKIRRLFIQGERGFALLLALIVLTLGMVLLPVALTYVTSGTVIQQKERTQTDRLYAADAGAEKGIWWVTKADHTGDPLPATVGNYKKLDIVTLGSNKIQTYITYLGKVGGADKYRVQSYSGTNVVSNASPAGAQPSPYTLATAEITLTSASVPLFGNAIGTLNGGITLGSNAVISCTPAPPPNNGNLAASGGNISLGANANVYGNAAATGTITKGANANIAGTSVPNSTPATYTSVDTAPYLAETQFAQPATTAAASTYANGGTISGSITLTGTLNLGTNKSLAVNGNLYMASGSISLGNNARLTVNGRTYLAAGSITGANNVVFVFNGSIYASGNVSTGNNAGFTIGGTVWVGGAITLSNNNGLSGAYTVVARDNITFNNNSVVATAQMPFIISTNGAFIFGNNVSVCGYLYAPNAGATISNNASVTGAIVARSVSVDNNCRVTYVSNQRAGLPQAASSATSSVVTWQISQN